MASALSIKTPFASRAAFVARPRRTTRVEVKAFTDSKQSVEEINKLIGQRIKEAAGQIGTMRIWQTNAAIGKYVKSAAADAASGKLKLKGSRK